MCTHQSIATVSTTTRSVLVRTTTVSRSGGRVRILTDLSIYRRKADI